MSLIKQLWLAIIIIVLVSFCGSVLISILSAKQYFEQQLYLKNVDNVNALAMTLSQLDKDQTTIELLVAATFDTGHYQRIELVDPDNKSIVNLRYQPPSETPIDSGDENIDTTERAPSWFVNWIDFNIKPGVAQVSDGWSQYGTLYIESHSEYAIYSLWRSCIKLFLSFLLVALAAGFIGSKLLKHILKPLNNVVDHATALGNKQFIMSPVPSTPEFAVVVQAINTLSVRFKKTITQGNKRLEKMRFQMQHDSLTGLASRNYFMGALSALISDQNLYQGQSALFIIKLCNLDNLNRNLDRTDVDELICEISESLILLLEDLNGRYNDSHIARLNGSEFAILFTVAADISLIRKNLIEMHQKIAENYRQEVDVVIVHAGCYIQKQSSISAMLKQLDLMLKKVQDNQAIAGALVEQNEAHILKPEEWKNAINEALSNEAIEILSHPVMKQGDELSHMQSIVGLNINDEVHIGGYYLQWAQELGLLEKIDLLALTRTLNSIQPLVSDNISLLISKASMTDAVTRSRIIGLLNQHPDKVQHICIEVKESCAIESKAVFVEFCRAIKATGAKFGLRQVGANFSKVPKIHELGLDTIKVDCAYVHNIANNQSNQFYIRGLCALAHSIGIEVVADGISSPLDSELIFEMGCDAIVPNFQDNDLEML
ncbi:bifunctional diguanylate cyclase/phosphodiesterase [Catenovulum adriaticum]|uniref:EAL domain-containing protein n=1 Tax=Catenovulum adriaticum TaxID=2984846 RepID=A0ABY7APA9_9ALTE|nr:LapD/MoxY N-terminal periplasmic domain-containing protein [Catenovulum sp. TS8]WAJ70501.1 EAL domain-containing protein [Catenovulum sp. TS8]